MPNKIYDIVLDTKRFSFNHDVRGVKQGDNNALLNITLTQNSIPLNLTGMGIRINYKRPDGEVFLQATTTTNATEGQIKVNILTKVLEKVGEVKADLCIFDIDNRKITSVTFTIFVDASIYTNDYIEEHDLDMIQQSMDAENARIANENLRVNNENARVISELNRIEKESTRESNETKRNEAESTRENNEKDRIANEDIRISNEKNRIANETNRVVKFETIKSDYNTYRKTMTSESNVAELQRQINENTEQLKENATKTLTSDSNFIDLKDAVGGFANLQIEGNTLVNLIKTPISVLSDSSNHQYISNLGGIYVPTFTVVNLTDRRLGINIFENDKYKRGISVDAHLKNVGTLSSTEVIKHVVGMQSMGWTDSNKEELKKIMILEGDCSNKTISTYFEGIKSVGEDGNLEVISRGKNLIPPMNITRNVLGVSVTLNSDGKCVLNGTATTGSGGRIAFSDVCPVIKLIANKTYYISCKILGGSYTGNIPTFALSQKSDNSFIVAVNIDSKNSILINEDKDCIYGLNFMQGSSFNNLEFNFQLEEGTTATSYEPYKEDKINIPFKEPLRGLPSGVRDNISSDGIITKKVGKIVLNGSESDWHLSTNSTTTSVISFFKTIINPKVIPNIICTISDKLKSISNNLWNDESEGILIMNNGRLSVKINKSKLSTPDLAGFKAWLQANPTTVYYELAEPIIEDTKQPLNIQTFKNGSIVIDSAITPYTTIEYASNINSRVSMLENTNANMLDSLGGAWRTLLILADRELKMKSISTLTTETPTDLKNKINEMIGAWK